MSDDVRPPPPAYVVWRAGITVVVGAAGALAVVLALRTRVVDDYLSWVGAVWTVVRDHALPW